MVSYINFLACVALCIFCNLHQTQCSRFLDDVADFVHSKRFEVRGKHENQVIKSRLLKSFSWSSCGQASDPTSISSISIGPDPVKLPGNISIGFDAKLNIPLKAPISLDLSIEKKELFWIPIPCIDNIGSCNYQDVCKMLPSIGCPPPLKEHGIPCQCPVKPGAFKLPPSPFFVNPIGVPSWLESGSYKVKAKLAMGSQEIACLQIQLSIG